jgi:deoxyadenosine/deoxycytidine kinase
MTTGVFRARRPARRGNSRRRVAEHSLILQPEDPRHLCATSSRDNRRGRSRRRFVHEIALHEREHDHKTTLWRHEEHRRDDIIGPALQFRYIAIEGPIGAGKTALTERLGTRLDATVVLEDMDNPFLADFYADRPGAALQAQLFYLLNRHRQQTSLRQADLFSQTTICDYLFDKDKIFAYLNLDDNELFIYQRLYELLARDIPPPDLVVYLQAPTDVILRRVRSRRSDAEAVALQPDDEYLRELNEAYHHYFFHYNSTPLLVVETSQFDSEASEEALDDLIKQIRAMGSGTRYYVPRTK